MNLAILPTVRQIRKDQFELSVDNRIFNFFDKVFKRNCTYKILNGSNKIKNEKLIIILGGNTIIQYSKKKRDKYRSILDKKYFSIAQKKKIKIIGICHGAQFLAKLFGAKLKKSTKHVNTLHKVFINKKSIKVNSFHDYIIYRYNKNFIPIGICDDNSLEYFRIKNKKIFGIIWHPERFNKVRHIDTKIFRDICN